ncbi:MAG: hypothetical protein ACK5Z0_06880 [Planctomycetota bacterium]|jgi:hypothetical protein
MPHSRTIAVLLALSALLCAGWTKTTHWHIPGHIPGHSHGHSSSQATNSVGDCCSVKSVAGECHVAVEAVFTLEDSPKVKSGRSHIGDHCSVCDFLAGHVYGLAMIYGYAGMLAESQWLPELLIDSPTSQEQWVSCRGPPPVA